MEVIWLVIAFPLLGSIILAMGKKMPGRSAGFIGSLAIALSAVCALVVFGLFKSAEAQAYQFSLWPWIQLGKAECAIAINVDSLSVIMILVVTIIGFLIHLFSVDHMEGEDGYNRFFSYMNLFVFFMLVLVLAKNMVLLYLGWEGVGLCSFLLIGFWYKDTANGDAARKAFIITRVGDVALLLGILLLAFSLGTLNISDASAVAQSAWLPGSALPVLAAALILGGAVGKSAQLPLHTWLPDAMAGPSPVSALIHAATMVTAGVYLIARTNAIFILAPQILLVVAIIGAATLLIAGATALFQRDLKRILAYSTMSQIGYMFLALGASAWSSAIFHLASHAIFKALLFLSAGAIINALGHERDIFNMGGMAKKKPLFFWTFLAGALGLAALPPVTAGFASKDAIIEHLWFVGGDARLFWWAAMLGVLFTSIYTFRTIFLVFSGKSRYKEPHGHHGHPQREGPTLKAPLVILAVMCVFAGFLDFPQLLGGTPFFTEFATSTLPHTAEAEASAGLMIFLSIAPFILGLAGIPLGLLMARAGLKSEASQQKPNSLAAFARGGFGFDGLYAFLFEKPILAITRRGADPINTFAEGIQKVSMFFSGQLQKFQDGRPRRYLALIGTGIALIIAAVVL